MNRRRAVTRMLGLAALPGLVAEACVGADDRPGEASFELTPLDLDRLQVRKRYVCQRPFRPQGFRLERTAVGDTTVVHNYGHGGGGMTLSWGTADRSIGMLDSIPESAVVVGCGVIGLSTGLLLRERGCRVRILAAEVPPNTTSNLSAANFFPSQVCAYEALGGELLDTIEAACRFSHDRYLRLMADPTFGITRHPQYFLSPEWSEEIAAGGPAYKRLRDLYPGQTLYGPGEHPFRTSYAFVEDNLFLDPDVYLARLVSEFRSVGGRIEIGRVAGPEGLSHLEERVVFNCTGLGARDVARDESVEPLMGQHLVLEPQDGVRYAVASARGDYMMATGSRVVLGGGNSISSPDELVERQRALLPRAPGRSG